jgi:hypothetical protein
MRNVYKILVGKSEEKRPLGRLGVVGRIILKWILNRMEGCGLNSSGLGLGPMVESCEHDNEPSSSIKGRNLLTSWVTVSFCRRILLLELDSYAGVKFGVVK